MTISTDRTTNCCEFFHSKFINEFYSKHSNIFNYIDVILENQIHTYTNFNSNNRRKNTAKRQKEDFLQYYINKYSNEEIFKIGLRKKS